MMVEEVGRFIECVVKMEESKLPTKEQREVLQEVAEIERTIWALIGLILYTDMPLEEVRKERLKKYEVEFSEN